METTTPGESLSSEQAAAKAAILAACNDLAATRINFVVVHFDGSGDEGAVEDVKCYNAEEYVHDEYEPVEHDASHLQPYFEVLVPFGFEDGFGGFGDVILDVRTKKITVIRNDYFEDYTTSTYEI